MKTNLPKSQGDIMSENPKDLLGVKKVPVNLIPPVSIIQEAMARKFGAYLTKRADGTTGYGPYNWREGQIQLSIYLAAIMRHWLAYLDGEDLASDRGVHHLVQIIKGIHKHSPKTMAEEQKVSIKNAKKTILQVDWRGRSRLISS